MANKGKRVVSRRQIALLAVLLVLAGGAWTFHFWQESRRAPIRRHIAEGQRLVEQGLGAAAEAHWRQAVRLDPQNAEAWELLGDYYAAVHDWPRARAAFAELARLAPETPRVWSRLAVAAAHLNDEKIVEQATDEALRRNADDVDALSLKSTLLAREEKWDEQLECLRRLVKLQPDQTEYAARLADALTALQKFGEARPLLEKIIARDPNFAAAYAMRAEGAIQEKSTAEQLAQAERDLRKSLALDGSQEKARLLLARLYLRREKPAQAVAQLQQLTALQPEKTAYWSELAGAFQAAGDTARAIAIRRRAAQIAEARDRRAALQSRLANDPQNFANNLEMGLLLLRDTNPLNADKYIAKALALRPKDARAQAAARQLESLYQTHLRAGLSAVKSGDIKRADHEISRAMLLRPRDPRTVQAVRLVAQVAAQANTR